MAGDYGGFKGIVDEARELAEAEQARPEVACPLCGKILDRNETRGEVNCPLGHYRAAMKGGRVGS